jgi:hypothetical protein
MMLSQLRTGTLKGPARSPLARSPVESSVSGGRRQFSASCSRVDDFLSDLHRVRALSRSMVWPMSCRTRTRHSEGGALSTSFQPEWSSNSFADAADGMVKAR